jgi:hypothetical protein
MGEPVISYEKKPVNAGQQKKRTGSWKQREAAA